MYLETKRMLFLRILKEQLTIEDVLKYKKNISRLKQR